MSLAGLFKRRKEQAAAKGPPSLPEGLRVYAVGDVHGCREQLRRLHRAIVADAAAAPARRLLIYLGDYIDRGSDSRGVIEELCEPAPAGFERVFLLGNHEDFLLQALHDRSALLPWLSNGGDQTCRAYGLEPTAPPDGADDLFLWLQEALVASLPARHRAFLEGLALSHSEGDYFFCHAGVRPDVALEAQSSEDLLWMREPFLSSRQSFGKVVVHGHTPSLAPECRGNRIGIDTGACYGGKLTALVLQGNEQRFLQS